MSSVHAAHNLTDVLSEEHALILRALESFERFAEQVRSGGKYDPRIGRQFVRLFREFADTEHHLKEEQILFPWLEQHGLPHEVGPLAVLREEHELGRDLRLALSFALDALREDPREAETRLRFHALARRFVELLRAHIEKEETVLLPLARRFAQQLDETPVVPGGARPEVRRAIESLAALAPSWPSPCAPGHADGTAYAFERLCEESLG
ncbi:MAG: hemerythrin domain-containing protein [Planctomycetota bacterium]